MFLLNNHGFVSKDFMSLCYQNWELKILKFSFGRLRNDFSFIVALLHYVSERRVWNFLGKLPSVLSKLVCWNFCSEHNSISFLVIYLFYFRNWVRDEWGGLGLQKLSAFHLIIINSAYNINLGLFCILLIVTKLHICTWNRYIQDRSWVCSTLEISGPLESVSRAWKMDGWIKFSCTINFAGLISDYDYGSEVKVEKGRSGVAPKVLPFSNADPTE